MKNKITLLAALVAGSMSFAAQADLIGAPTTYVKKGSFGIGLEYTDQRMEQEQRLQFGITPKPYNTKFSTTELKAYYGLMEHTALSFRWGRIGNGHSDLGTASGQERTNGQSGDVLGFGVETVVYQSGPLSVGLSGRYTMRKYEGSYTGRGPQNRFGTEEVDIGTVDGGVGVGYALTNAFTLYGGLLAQRTQGDRAGSTNSGPSATVPHREQNVGRGYVGVRYQMGGFSVGLEAQTESTWGLSAAFQF